MEIIIVDTSVWVDYFAGISNKETEWLDRAIGRELVSVTDLILCEILQGIRTDRQHEQTRLWLLSFDVFPSGGVEMAIAAATNHRRLRSRGFTVRKTIDCLIATFCIRNKYSLLHRDRDFEPFESELGLRVVRPG